MSTPKWFQIACGLLLLNVAIVVSSITWRLAVADEPAESATEGRSTSGVPSDDAPATVEDDPANLPPSSESNLPLTDNPFPGVDSTIAEPLDDRLSLDNLPLPDELPAVPSLGDPSALEKDPVFQELRNLFSDAGEPTNDQSQLFEDNLQSDATDDYFKILDSRLESAVRLCNSARAIAAEAESLSRRGDNQGAEQLLRLATQLRDIAAQLLVRKL